MDYWRGYKEKLKVFENETENRKRRRAEDYPEEINKLMRQLKTAAENMDIDKLDELGNQLNDYCFEDDNKLMAENIQKAILNFNVEFLKENSNLIIL